MKYTISTQHLCTQEKWKEQKFTNENTELGTLHNGFAELYYYLCKIHAAIMVAVTFEISHI